MLVKQRAKATKRPPSARVSVSVSPELQDTLEKMAKQKKVSVAWIIRDALDKYVADQWPLFEQPDERSV
ncbi:MAG: CopG family transcriptional regulator [Burkholderiales bacterium]|nr:CopG family transcriptional regulator [Burkholderiales bacterium]